MTDKPRSRISLTADSLNEGQSYWIWVEVGPMNASSKSVFCDEFTGLSSSAREHRLWANFKKQGAVDVRSIVFIGEV